MEKSGQGQVRFFLKKQISFPWISPFHQGHLFKKKLEQHWEHQWKEIPTIYWAFIMG